MFTKLTTAAILTIALGGFSLLPAEKIPVRFQDQDSEDSKVSACVTLSFESVYGMPPQAVDEILHNRILLSSIHPKLVLEDDLRGAHLKLETVSDNIISIRVAAAQESLAKEALDAILKQLPKFEPSDAGAAKLRLKEAEEMLVSAQAEADAVNEARNAFIQKNGPIDPHELYQQSQSELSERTVDLDHTRFELATHNSARELYKELLAKEPTTVEERRMIPNVRKVLLERQLEAITNMPLSPAIEKSPTGDISIFLESQERWIAKIEKQLTDAALMDTEVVSKVTNPRRAELETQLFQEDHELAELKAREQALAPRVEKLRADAMLGWRLHSDWDLLTSKHDAAQNNVQEAQAMLRDAKDVARQFARGPWMKVVSGPTFSTR